MVKTGEYINRMKGIKMKALRTHHTRLIIASLLCIAFIMSMLPSISAKAIRNEAQIVTKTLYYLSEDDKAAMKEGIPKSYDTSYQIDLSGFNNPTVKVVKGCSVEVDESGLVTPTRIMLGQAKAWGYTKGLDNIDYVAETPNYTMIYIPYPSTVQVSDGTKTKTYEFNLVDYAEVFVDNKLNGIISSLNLSQYSSQVEKLRVMTEYVADNTSYDTSYSLLKNIVIYEKGDCISNSQMIRALCKKAGITSVRLRRSYQDQAGEGNGHINTYVECDGVGYLAEVYAGEKGRGWYVIKEENGYCAVGNTFYQYDGFSEKLYIPEYVDGTEITTIGRTDRFDPNKYASILYDYVDDCSVTYINIPASITKINPGAFSGNSRLKGIGVDTSNPIYSNDDSGNLYSKNGETLYYVPAAKKEIYLFNNLSAISEHAFDDVEDLDVFYNGTETQWNNIVKGNIPDTVHVYFGHARATGIQHNDEASITFKHRYDMVELNCSVLPDYAANKEIKYSSNNDDVCIVIGNKAYAIGEGKATITATAIDTRYDTKPITTTYDVTCLFEGYNLTLEGGVIESVKDSSGKELEGYEGLASVKIMEDATVTIKSDGSYDDFKEWQFPEGVNPTTNPEQTTGRISFKMPNKDITISAKYYNMTVQRIDSIEAEKTTICEGESVQLTAKVYPEYAHNKKMKWTSSNTGNVTVDENGVVTGATPGAQILVTATSVDNPNATKNIYISVKPHNSDGERRIIQVGDCIETPYIVEYDCPDCGETIREVIEPDGEHYWDDGVGKDATCTEAGDKVYTCLVCGMTKEEHIDALGHDYQDVEKLDPTCTEPGHKAGRRCTRCGDVASGCDEITPLGHDYQHVDKKEPTCSEKGHTEGSVCSRCGDIESGCEDIPAAGHSWGEWKVTKEATETAEGVKTRTCSKCGTKETASIPKKEKSGGSSDGGNSGSGNDGSGSKKDDKPKYSNEWIDGKWYDADGTCTYEGLLSWKSNATGWWVEDSAGWYPTDSWQKIDGVWYYFKPDGYMAMNEYYNGYWFNADGSWDDKYLLSWKSNSSGWWVEDISGWWPASQWLKIDGYWYYFDASGYMVTSQYVDGYWIGADGVCY